MIFGVGLKLGEPDDFLGINGFAVDDCGNLSVASARVKADTAAV